MLKPKLTDYDTVLEYHQVDLDCAQRLAGSGCGGDHALYVLIRNLQDRVTELEKSPVRITNNSTHAVAISAREDGSLEILDA